MAFATQTHAAYLTGPLPVPALYLSLSYKLPHGSLAGFEPATSGFEHPARVELAIPDWQSGV